MLVKKKTIFFGLINSQNKLCCRLILDSSTWFLPLCVTSKNIPNFFGYLTIHTVLNSSERKGQTKTLIALTFRDSIFILFSLHLSFHLGTWTPSIVIVAEEYHFLNYWSYLMLYKYKLSSSFLPIIKICTIK